MLSPHLYIEALVVIVYGAGPVWASILLCFGIMLPQREVGAPASYERVQCGRRPINTIRQVTNTILHQSEIQGEDSKGSKGIFPK